MNGENLVNESDAKTSDNNENQSVVITEKDDSTSDEKDKSLSNKEDSSEST